MADESSIAAVHKSGRSDTFVELQHRSPLLLLFFFNDTATTEIYTLSLHDALPICGLLTMDQARTFANIARRVQGPETDGQRVQHFMSTSPWSAQAVLAQVLAPAARDRKSTRLNSSHT